MRYMNEEIGEYEGTIVGTENATLGQNRTPAVIVEVELEDKSRVRPAIFITEKSARMARAALKACGFDVDNADMGSLDDDPSPLAWNKVRVRVMMDDRNPQKMKAEIVFGRAKVERPTLEAAMATLRSVASPDTKTAQAGGKAAPARPASPPPSAPRSSPARSQTPSPDDWERATPAPRGVPPNVKTKSDLGAPLPGEDEIPF